MVVTFGNGLEERIASKRAAANQAPETVWQAHLRERKEKKRAKNVAGTAGGELHDGDAAGAGDEDLGFNDPFFASADDGGAAARRKKKRGQGSEVAPAADAATARDEARRRAELELLLLDDARLKAGAAPLRMRGTAREDAAAADGDVAQMSEGEMVDMEALAALPTSMQLEFIQRHREQQTAANRQRFAKASETAPAAFSAAQMDAYIAGGRVKRQLTALVREGAGAPQPDADVPRAQRIAGDTVRRVASAAAASHAHARCRRRTSLCSTSSA